MHIIVHTGSELSLLSLHSEMDPCQFRADTATVFDNLQVLISKHVTVNVVNHWNLTPLATAVISNQHQAAQLLREHGASLCSKMHRSFYPLHAATITGKSDPNFDFLFVLLTSS